MRDVVIRHKLIVILSCVLVQCVFGKFIFVYELPQRCYLTFRFDNLSFRQQEVDQEEAAREEEKEEVAHEVEENIVAADL